MDGDRITIDDSSDLVRTVANAADGTAGEIVVTGARAHSFSTAYRRRTDGCFLGG